MMKNVFHGHIGSVNKKKTRKQPCWLVGHSDLPPYYAVHAQPFQRALSQDTLPERLGVIVAHNAYYYQGVYPYPS